MGNIAKLPSWAQQHIAGLNTNIASLERRLERVEKSRDSANGNLQIALYALCDINSVFKTDVQEIKLIAYEAIKAIEPE